MENWVYAVWKLSDSPSMTSVTVGGNISQKKIKQVSKNVAMKIIRDEGLIIALQNEDGTIWDTPDRAYYNKWKGFKFSKNM